MNAAVRERYLFDLWSDELPQTNWRPRIEPAALERLAAELVVFHRVAHVTVRSRRGEPVHLDIEHPLGVGAPSALYQHLGAVLRQRSGFTYAVGPVRGET